MATLLTNIVGGKVNMSVSANSQKALDLSTPSDAFNLKFNLSLAFGDLASQIDLVWHDIRIIASGADDILDFAGSLVDGFGDTLTFANIKAIFIKNVSDQLLTDPAHAITAAQISVGATAANQFLGPFALATDSIVLGAGDAFLVTKKALAGMTVTAGSVDNFLVKQTGSGLEAAYEIAVFGVST